MKLLTKYEQIDSALWDDLIAHSAVATWFQTREAYLFYASLPDMMEPFCYAVQCDKGELKGIIVGYITREQNAIKQHFTRRVIIIGGPALRDDICDKAVTALLQLAKTELHKKAIYVETRNFNDYSRWRSLFESTGFAYQPHLNFHIDTSSIEQIDGAMGRDRKRGIRISLRDGAYIIKEPTLQQVRELYTILRSLYKTKIHTPLFDWSFFEQLYKQPSARFLLVGYQDRIIGGTVCVVMQKQTVYEWFVCGLDGEIKNISPSVLATYAGMEYAVENDCPRFDMMGAGTPDEHYGVRDFKARFGGTLVEHGRFLYITNPLLYKIGSIGVKILKNMK